MASSIQLLRSNNAQERPFPGNLLDGQPAINTNSQEPGLFFKANDGTVIKIGPAAITSDGNPPNAGAVGQPGNTVGELWLDKSLSIPVLKVYDGVQWVDAGSGGGVSPGIVTLQRWIKTATGGEVSISGQDDTGQTLSYTAGIEEVFLNGVLLTRGVDYSALTGTSITALTPLLQGDVITVLGWTPFNVLDEIDGANLIDGTVTNQKLAVGSISSSNIINETIVDADISPVAAVQSTKLSFTANGAGAVPRSVSARLNDVINVKDFGAVGNITTDDTAAIQAAINSVPTTGKEGLTAIFFPTGEYRITASLTVVSRSVVFIGEGPMASIIRPQASVEYALDIDTAGTPLKITAVLNLGIREIGASPNTTLIRSKNCADTIFNNLFLICSGRLIDHGPNNNIATWSQIRGEAYGGMEAIRFRSGGGTLSNMLIRKYDLSGYIGPTFWWQGSPLSTSLEVTNCSIGGTGALYRIPIQSISSTLTTFTVTTTENHGFEPGDWAVVRSNTSAYLGTWIVKTATPTTVTVESDVNYGPETPTEAYLETPRACLYVDSTLGPINETGWTNIIFEGIDSLGTAGQIGSVAVWLDGRKSTGTPFGSNVYGHRYSDCYFDVGQTAVLAQGLYVAGDTPIVSGIRIADSQIVASKVGIYMSNCAGMQIIGNTIMPVDRSKGGPNDPNNSAAIWANGLLGRVKGLQIESNTIGRQSDWRTDVISFRNFDYGLKLDGPSQDTYVIGNHIYGGVEATKFEGTAGATTLNADTRLVFANNMLANGAGESSSTRIPTIASASTITLGPNDIYKISGTTTVTTMNGGWIGRMVQLITTSALTFSGASFNNSKTTVAGELVTAVFDGSKWSL
jgi:hypothetical protein